MSVEEFGSTSTAAEVAAGLDLSGKNVVVTGAGSGIGLETARALAGTGARVTLLVRDRPAGERAAASIVSSTGNEGVDVQVVDLADLGTVDDFTRRWREPLHILVNNAGVMFTPLERTVDGWELQLATNHLGHFALATGLQPALAADGAARVVSVSSSGHAASPVVFDDLFFDRRPYDPVLAYGQSKTAQVLFAVEASRRWAGDGITANAVMPGGVWTGLQRHWDPAVLAAMKDATAHSGAVKTPEQGAATSVYVATSASLAGIGGRYFEDCREAEVVEEIVDGLHGVRDYALDPAAATRLWEVSSELLASSLARRTS